MRDRTPADDTVQGAANRALLDLILPPMRTVAAKQRWTIAVHGSLNRDIDLIAVPWEVDATERDKFVSMLCGAVAGVAGSWNGMTEDQMEEKLHDLSEFEGNWPTDPNEIIEMGRA